MSVNEDDLVLMLQEVDGNIFSVDIDFEEDTVTLTKAYKTGDGCDQPYSDYPPDDMIIEEWEKQGFRIGTEGVMHYYPDDETGVKFIYGYMGIGVDLSQFTTNKELADYIKQYLSNNYPFVDIHSDGRVVR